MTEVARGFASDNYAGVHPAVLEAIAKANVGHMRSYGADPVTTRAQELFREEFGQDIEVLLTFNGTGANVVGLQAILFPFESVICADTAHIHVDECGAPERFLGSKLVDVATTDGKLTPALVEAAAGGVGDQHHVQPRVVSIAQPTELGTLYQPSEIAALADWAHDHDLLLHLDGARLPNAAAALGCSLGDLGAPLGVDVMSFGGTKNGAMGAEAVIFFNAENDVRAHRLRYLHKQSMQLGSKMRFIAAQLVALLETGLWRENATRANRAAELLAAEAGRLPGVEISYAVEANAVFAVIPPGVAAALQREYPFYVWDESAGQVRWMTSFDTEPDDVHRFVEHLAALLAA